MVLWYNCTILAQQQQSWAPKTDSKLGNRFCAQNSPRFKEDSFCKWMPPRLESPSRLQSWPSNVESQEMGSHMKHVFLLSQCITLGFTLPPLLVQLASQLPSPTCFTYVQTSWKFTEPVQETPCQIFDVFETFLIISSCLFLICFLCTHERLKTWCALQWKVDASAAGVSVLAFGATTVMQKQQELPTPWSSTVTYDFLPKDCGVVWSWSIKNITCLSGRGCRCCGFGCLHEAKMARKCETWDYKIYKPATTVSIVFSEKLDIKVFVCNGSLIQLHHPCTTTAKLSPKNRFKTWKSFLCTELTKIQRGFFLQVDASAAGVSFTASVLA